MSGQRWRSSTAKRPAAAAARAARCISAIRRLGMLPAIAIVGGGNTVVTGLGLAFKLMRTDQVAVCFFGDGATNEGAFHEGLNFAAVQHLPIVFACENNLYGASTPFHR